MMESQSFNQDSNRGRNYSRGSRKPTASQARRGVGRTRGFFSPTRQNLEQTKLDNTRKEMEQTILDSEDVARKQQANPNQSKKTEQINKNIELGKQFISTYFKSFVKPEKGNIKIDLDETIDDRLTEPYINRLDTHLQLHYVDDYSKRLKEYHNRFKGIANVGIAIKLFRSAPDEDMTLLDPLTSVRLGKITLPKKMALIINQMGKTNLLNDNVIRLNEHHLLVKKFMCKALIYYLGKDIDPYLNNNNKVEVFTIALFDHWDHMIDKTIKSVQLLRTKGRKFFEQQVNKNYGFKISSKTYYLKLPDFNFDREVTPEHVVEYFKNDIFVDFTFETADLKKLLGTLVFQVVKYNWFTNQDKLLEVLEPKFKDTIVAKLSFTEILSYSKIWFLEDFINQSTMDDLTTDLLSNWHSAHSPLFREFLEMEEVKFSEFGTDAQLIQVESFVEGDNIFSNKWKKIKNRSRIKSILKTSEHGAVIGLSTAFSKDVKFSSKFEVSYDGKNNAIYKEIIESDFKK